MIFPLRVVLFRINASNVIDMETYDYETMTMELDFLLYELYFIYFR